VYALDTNTLIYFFKGRGHVAERMLATAPSQIAIPSVVLYEIETGIAKSNQTQERRSQLGELLEVVAVLPFDGPAAREAAAIRAELERSGTPIGPLDTLIAATAVASGSILVTHNLQEFTRVPQLHVTDWYE
jgi:tRNA(fMet)-specific endonuclease VapC